MASSNNNEIISKVSPHSIKKFELIEAYVLAWAHKLLEYGRNTGNCNGIVFIDCMNYQAQQAWLYFNDLSQEKIDELSKHLPPDTRNFHIKLSAGDGNDLLKAIGSKLSPQAKVNYLLVYSM